MATEVRKGDRAPGSESVADVTYDSSTVIYGKSGSGKSTLASTWPKPMLYLNILDNGTDSLSDVEDVDVVHIKSSDDLKEILLWCAKQANRGKLIYKSIVCDTMTQLQKILVTEATAKKAAQIRASKKMPGDYGTLTMQEWGLISGDLKAMILDIRNLPLDCVFICQERAFNIDTDEGEENIETLEPEVSVSMMKSIKADITSSCDNVVRTFIKLRIHKKTKDEPRSVEKVYCLLVGPHSVYTTKIRKPRGITLPDYIEDATFRKVMKLKKGKF